MFVIYPSLLTCYFVLQGYPAHLTCKTFAQTGNEVDVLNLVLWVFLVSYNHFSHNARNQNISRLTLLDFVWNVGEKFFFFQYLCVCITTESYFLALDLAYILFFCQILSHSNLITVTVLCFRGLTLLVGWLAFFAAFFPVHFLLKGQKLRSKIEVTYLISHAAIICHNILQLRFCW